MPSAQEQGKDVLGDFQGAKEQESLKISEPKEIVREKEEGQATEVQKVEQNVKGQQEEGDKKPAFNEDEVATYTCTMSIDCSSVFEHMGELDVSWK